MRVGVVGLGLIGGSLLRALDGAVGYDADGAVREAAAAEGFEVAGGFEGLAGCGLVLVAVPPGRTPEAVAAVLSAAPAAMVADTASVKAPILRAVRDPERFVGAHPMAGAERSGWAASTAGLVAGATWAACPAGEALEPLLALAAVVDALGGRLVLCTGEDHDAAVARTSHVPHLVASALAALAPRSALAGRAFRDMTRVAHADPALWAEILHLNREAVGDAVEELAARLAELRALLVDEAALREAWRSQAPAGEAAWREQTVEGGWHGLLALDRRPVRRLRADGGVLRAEVAA